MAQGAEVLAVLNSIFENRRQDIRDDRAFELDTLKFRESQKIAKQELAFKSQAQSLAMQEFALKKKEAFSNEIKEIQKPIIAGRNARLDSIFDSLILPELTNEDNAIIETSGTGDNASTTYSLENFNKLYVNKYGFTKDQASELFGQLTGYHQNKTNSQLMVDYMDSMLRYKGELPPMFDEALEMNMQIKFLDKEHSDMQLGDYEFNELAKYMNQQDIDDLANIAEEKEKELKDDANYVSDDINVNNETKELLDAYTQNLGIKLDSGPGSGNTGRYVLNMDNMNFDKSNWGEIDKGMTLSEKETIFETRMDEVNNAILQQEGGIKDIQDYRNNLEQDAKLGGQIELDKFNQSSKAKAIDDAIEKLRHNTGILRSEHSMLSEQEELYESQRRGENFDKFLDFGDRASYYVGSIGNLMGPGGTEYGVSGQELLTGLPTYNPDTEVFRYANEPDKRTAVGDVMYGLRKTRNFFGEYFQDVMDYQEEKNK